MGVFGTQNCIFILYTKGNKNPSYLDRKLNISKCKEHILLAPQDDSYLYIETIPFLTGDEYVLWNKVYTEMNGPEECWTKKQWEDFVNTVSELSKM